MTIRRRRFLFGLTALCAGCATANRQVDPIVGRWRDVRYQDAYEFSAHGGGRFELFVPPDADPELSAVILPSVNWRRVRAGYEIVLRSSGLDGGVIETIGRAHLEGARLVTDISQRDGTLTLERIR